MLEPGDVQQAGLQLDLIPSEGDQLGGAEAMAVSDHDQQSITLTYAPAPATGCDYHAAKLGCRGIGGAASPTRLVDPSATFDAEQGVRKVFAATVEAKHY